MKPGFLWGFVLFSLSSLAAQSTFEPLPGSSYFSSESVIQSIKEAYPGIITKVIYKNGDWHLTVRGEAFIWAEGRLIPESQNLNEIEYGAYPFYKYSSEYTPPLPVLNEEQEKAIDQMIAQGEANPISRHPGFLKALYRIQDEASAWNIMKTTYFLGHKVMIHRDLLEDLARVEETLIAAMLKDSSLANYVESIGSLEGFHWRIIEGTQTLSNHSFGIAIDIIPVDYQDKEAYWRWSKAFFPKWYALSWSQRYKPPAAFVDAFEQEGFIWGGKWFFFDSIHFEYRPEILVLNNMR